MAEGTALSLDRRVLVNEWSERIDVALCANGVLGSAYLSELRLEGAVRVVAVGALEQPFVDPMMEWLRKSRLDVCMALIAERGLLGLEHFSLGFKLVHAVTVRTTDQSLAVSGTLEVGMFADVA
jgi:hypothetical protein